MSDINTPGGWDGDLKLLLEWLTDEKKDRLFEMLKQEKANKEKKLELKLQLEKKLLWKSYEEVNDYLKKKYVKIKENQEFLGCKWRIVEINLPAVVDRHEWIKIKWFMSYDSFSKQEFIENSKFEDNSYSKEEINNVIHWINKYYNAISPKREFKEGCLYWLVDDGFLLHDYWGYLHFRLKEKDPLRRDTWHGSMYHNNWWRGRLLLKIPE